MTISGGGVRQLFVVVAGNTLNLTGLTLTGGANTSLGGAILARSNSFLNISGCTVSRNSATTQYGYGGALGSGGTVTITNSTFSGNSTGASGGAIYMSLGSLTITGSTFTGNSASGDATVGYGDGGAIDNGGGSSTLSLTLSVVAGNTVTGGFGPDNQGRNHHGRRRQCDR